MCCEEGGGWFLFSMSIFRAARKALGKYVSEVKRVTTPRPFDFREELMLWNFAEEDTAKWDCISDTDITGFSSAEFQPNRKGNIACCMI